MLQGLGKGMCTSQLPCLTQLFFDIQQTTACSANLGRLCNRVLTWADQGNHHAKLDPRQQPQHCCPVLQQPV